MSQTAGSRRPPPGRQLDAVFDQRRDIDEVFRVALRHSRRVRALRVLVPLVVVGLILLPLAYSAIRSIAITVPLGDFGRLVLSGSKLTMEAPRLAGFTKDNQAYEVTAKRAQQDVTQPHLVDLEEIRAKVDLANKGRADLIAEHGQFDAKTELLTLSRGIFLKSSEGYEGRLTEAKIDVRAGTIVSNKPVELKFLQGDLRADTMDLRDKGQVVRFEGGVVLNVMLPQSAGTAGEASGALR
ncbi:LPS export ABC transporter periplasmic protein LptC [Blastochloris sulfoviridis]|uniref:LPS export ABC transporter periplasmic protein LptC n=1 Tax=Blastochloris sulfoviridis TaxID=50712 RepID=A0A5M6I400_9HYPH|nr:LPS export ABC transporter periplasmic protein LptC [Blastochloris sulfoviridis]KAA5602934.1 LPS export ABC transporter periplasmic protein LptC [Blastochloris sulfoviridis]